MARTRPISLNLTSKNAQLEAINSFADNTISPSNMLIGPCIPYPCCSSTPNYCGQPMIPLPCVYPPMMYGSPCPIMYGATSPVALPPEPLPCYEYNNYHNMESYAPIYTNTPQNLSTWEAEKYNATDSRRMTASEQRSTWRSVTNAQKTVSDFEETNWIPVDSVPISPTQDLMVKRDRTFQKSVELPNGCILSLNVTKPTEQHNGSVSSSLDQVTQMKITGQVRRWNWREQVVKEEDFEETLYLPLSTDMSSISYKLQSKNLRLAMQGTGNINEVNTSYDDADEQEMLQSVANTVVFTGRLNPNRNCVYSRPIRTWSKEYRQMVSGRVDLSNSGRPQPVISTYTDVPEFVANHTTTPDQDFAYALVDNGCQVKIRIDEKVDKSSITFKNDINEEKVTVLFDRHDEDGETSFGHTDYDIKVIQHFRFSSEKYILEEITMNVEHDMIILFAPFRKSINFP